VRLTERAAGERLILRVAVHGPARDRAGRADHSIALAHALRLAPREDRRPDHLERSRIAQKLEPVARGDLARVLQ
jgi:hypothetical protein